MRTLANSEDQDEMPHYATCHQGLHYLLRKKSLFRESNAFLIWKLLPHTLRYIQWSDPSLLYQTIRKTPFVHKGLSRNVSERLYKVPPKKLKER